MFGWRSKWLLQIARNANARESIAPVDTRRGVRYARILVLRRGFLLTGAVPHACLK